VAPEIQVLKDSNISLNSLGFYIFLTLISGQSFYLDISNLSFYTMISCKTFNNTFPPLRFSVRTSLSSSSGSASEAFNLQFRFRPPSSPSQSGERGIESSVGGEDLGGSSEEAVGG